MPSLCSRLTVLLLLCAPLAVRGQDTARTVQLVPSELAGIVRDTGNVPLRDVEIVLPMLSLTARTDAAGKFILLGVAPGVHEVWFRRIGYTSVQFEWPAVSGKRIEVAITLHTLPNTLDPVTVWANERRSLASTSMITGIVVDSGGVPVANADLQLIGASRSTISADDGTFTFRHVPPGAVTVRARHMGFSPVALMIELGDDDQRAVTLRVRRLDQVLDTVKVVEASGYGSTDKAWHEFDVRERWRSKSGQAVAIGPQRLQEAGGMPLDWLMRPYQLGTGARAASQIDPNNGGREPPRGVDPEQAKMSCILENGIQPRFLPLSTYLAKEVDRVEYYPPAPPEREYTGTVSIRLGIFPQCGKQINGGHPEYFVVWLKGAR